MLINFRTVMKPSHHGQGSHLSSDLPDACRSRGMGGDGLGSFVDEGAATETVSCESCYIAKSRHITNIPGKQKRIFQTQTMVSVLAVTHRNRICYTRSCLCSIKRNFSPPT